MILIHSSQPDALHADVGRLGQHQRDLLAGDADDEHEHRQRRAQPGDQPGRGEDPRAVGTLDLAADNPWRFSSEYADDATATVYYNYRHYEPMSGRWTARDSNRGLELNLYLFSRNSGIYLYDSLGLNVPTVTYVFNVRYPDDAHIPENENMALTSYRLSDITNFEHVCPKGERGVKELSLGAQLEVTYYIDEASMLFHDVKVHEEVHVSYDLKHARLRDLYLMDGTCLCEDCFDNLRDYLEASRRYLDDVVLFVNQKFDFYEYGKLMLHPVVADIESIRILQRQASLRQNWMSLVRKRSVVLTSCKDEKLNVPAIPPLWW